MEFIIGILFGIVGVVLTIYFGIRSKKHEKALTDFYKIDLEKRKLVNQLIDIQSRYEENQKELEKIRSKISGLNEKQDEFFDPRDYPQGMPCPKCGEEMLMDDVDYYYSCMKCGYEIDARKT